MGGLTRQEYCRFKSRQSRTAPLCFWKGKKMKTLILIAIIAALVVPAMTICNPCRMDTHRFCAEIGTITTKAPNLTRADYSNQHTILNHLLKNNL